MNSFFSFLLLLVFPICICNGQQQETSQIKLYKVSLKLDDGSYQKGILYNITDSTIEYIPITEYNIKQLKHGNPYPNSIPVGQIDYISVKRLQNHAALTGFWLAGIGGFTYFMINLNNDKGTKGGFSSEGAIVAVSLVGGGCIGLGGGIIGTIIGVFPRKSIFNNRKATLPQSSRDKIERFTFKGQLNLHGLTM